MSFVCILAFKLFKIDIKLNNQYVNVINYNFTLKYSEFIDIGILFSKILNASIMF